MTSHEQPHPKRRRRIIIGVIAGGLILVLLLVGFVWSRFNAALATVNATETVQAERGDQTQTVTLSGTLEPSDQANASFAVSGTVTKITVKVGDTVKKGEKLATVDNTDLANALDLAKANLAAAQAQAETVRGTDGVTSAQIAAVDAQVEAMKANVTSAQHNLDDATLTAPLSGVVAEVSLEVGDQVSGSSGSISSATSGLSGVDLSGLTGSSSTSATDSGQIVIIKPDSWQLAATVGTADLPLLQPGQEAVVTPTGTSTQVDAVVDTVGIVASSSSGSTASFPVTLSITRSDVDLFSGSDADAVVTTEVIPDVLTVPVEAVSYDGDQATVQRPDGTTTTVTVGRQFGDRQEIVQGLSTGDEVLIPVGVASTAAARSAYGPNGTMASPDPTESANG